MTRIAIAHDYLTQRGGAEKVVLAMARAFPEAPIYTLLYEPATTFPEFASLDVRTSPLNRVGVFRRNHRAALPLLALAASRLTIEADVVIASSSGWAHGIHTPGAKLVYCYTPARWLYQADTYLGASAGLGARALLGALAPGLRRWDRAAAASATRYLAISNVVHDRIDAAYGIDSQVLPAPYAVDAGGSQTPVAVEPGYFLCVSRLLPYKKVDAVIAAFGLSLGRRLVVVGAGPMEQELRASLPSNVTMLGSLGDAELRWLYANCVGLVAASYEDFGLTPLEAASFGKPSVVLRYGGFLDTVLEGETGVFFERPEPAAIAAAVDVAADRTWSATAIKDHVEQFSEPRFAAGLRSAVAALAGAAALK